MRVIECRPRARIRVAAGLLAATAIASSPPCLAQWQPDGIAICAATGPQTFPAIASDGTGGAIVAWQDVRGADPNVYVQRVDAAGTALWGADGLLLCSSAGEQSVPVIVSDEAGGAFVLWSDARSGEFDIYAQRIGATGALSWAALGVVVCDAPGDQFMAAAVLDGAGGLLVAWSDARGGDADLYAQRLDATGTTIWTSGGVVVSTAPGHQAGAALVADGAGGGVVVWDDSRGAGADVYAQRLDAAGTVIWTVDGVAVCAALGDQLYPCVVIDGSGGVVVAWEDSRGADNDIYAQALTSAGVAAWAPDGIGICTLPGDQQNPVLDVLASGDVLVAWHDGRSGFDADIFAQRIDGGGTALWMAGGAPVCTAPGDQFFPVAASTPSGGAVLVWFDRRSGAFDVMAQRLDASGAPAWAIDGAGVCVAPGDQAFPRATRDGLDGVIVAWADERGPSSDIYAHRIAASSVVDASSGPTVPARLLLGAPRPNPTQAGARFVLWLPSAGVADVDVLDVAGRRVRRLVSTRLPQGSTTLEWDGTGEDGEHVPDGVYFIRSRVGATTASRRVTVIR